MSRLSARSIQKEHQARATSCIKLCNLTQGNDLYWHATYSTHDNSVDTLIREVDNALYQTKNNGRIKASTRNETIPLQLMF